MQLAMSLRIGIGCTVWLCSWSIAVAQLRPQQANAAQSFPGQAGNQSAAPGTPLNPIQGKPAVAPFGAISAEQEKYVVDVLNLWERQSGQIDRYAAKFTRWKYDPARTNGDIHATYAVGDLRYMKPDKGLYKVESLSSYTGKGPDGKPKYETFPGQHGDWWVCDGNFVSNLDREQKIATKFKLPSNLQGNSIVNSPLPFVFGMEAAKTLERFWIRPIVDKNVPQHLILLEVFPKRGDDALNYHHVHVFLSRDQFLPAAITIFDTNWTLEFPVREHFEFTDWKVNATVFEKLLPKMFTEDFIPQPDRDWKIVEKNFEEEPAASPQGNARVATPGKPNGVR